MMLDGRRITALAGLAITLCASVLVAATLGAMDLGVGEVVTISLEALGVDVGREIGGVERSVLWVIRAPRLVMSVLIGGALGLSGASLQGIFRNPLADPGLIGVSSGAALFAVGSIVFGAMVGLPEASWTIPLAAFVGALAATMCVLRLATRGDRIDMATMLRAGIALNAMAGALIGFATYVADDAQLRSLTMWSLGSLAASSWSQVGWVAALVVPGSAVVLLRARALDLMLLGEREASHLGVDVTRVRRTIVVASALIVGVGVGFTGIIGFVGLVVPHLLRLTGGASHRWVLPGSMLGGALLLVIADTMARTLAAPAELPVGVLTSMVGAPFFLGLLMRQRRRMW
jgi:iron complex transport system permease protein